MAWKAITRARALALLLAACDSQPDPAGTYGTEYDPPVVIYATVNCDRLVPHAVLSLGGRVRDFDLSINVVEDCSRSGGGFSFWEVLLLGSYTVAGRTLAFTMDSATAPTFSALFDGTHVTLTLPPTIDSLAPVEVVLRVGPRSPL